MNKPKKVNKTPLVFLLVFIICSFALTQMGVADYLPEIMVVLWMLAITIFLYLSFAPYLLNSNDRILFWTSYVTKICYMFYRFGFGNFSNPTLSLDAHGFWKVANQYYLGDFSRIYTPFPYILNAEFNLFGVNILCCILVNIALSMIMVGIVFSILDRFNVKGSMRLLSGIFVCFMPYAFQLSTSLLREAIYFCFITISFASYIRYIYQEKQRYLYLGLIALVPVLALHIGYFPIALVYFVELLRSEKTKTVRDLFGKLIVIGLFAGFIVMSSSFNSVEYLTGSAGGIEGLINKLTSDGVSETTANAGSLYLPGIYITSVRSFLLYSPLKWLFYIASPLPMNWRGLTDVVAFFLDGFVHVVVLVSGMKGVSLLKHRYKERAEETDGKMLRVLRAGLWAVVLCAFVFGMGTKTAGTAIRHRDVLLGIEVVIFALSLMVKKMYQNDLAQARHVEK